MLRLPKADHEDPVPKGKPRKYFSLSELLAEGPLDFGDGRNGMIVGVRILTKKRALLPKGSASFTRFVRFCLCDVSEDGSPLYGVWFLR